jgi:hypothetical protein
VVVAVRNKTKVERYSLVLVNDLYHTVLYRHSVGVVICYIVNLQCVTKVYICPVYTESVSLVTQIVNSTECAIVAILVVTVVSTGSAKLTSVNLKLEVNLATHGGNAVELLLT